MIKLKANELRIGNYYQERDKYYKADITDIINLERIEKHELKSEMKSILITKEIVSMCGFKEDKDYSNILFTRMTRQILYTDFELSALFGRTGNMFQVLNLNSKPTRIKTLHGLQNLYYDIGGYELKVNIL